MSTFNNGNIIGYDWVEEEIVSDDDLSIKTRRYFNNEQEEKIDDNPKFSYSPVYINYENGLPIKTEYYENNDLVRQEDYEYLSTHGYPIKVLIDVGDHYNTDQMLGYNYNLEWPKLSLKSVTEYCNDNITLTDSYSHTYNSYDLPSQVSHTVDGTTYTQHFLYPFDFNDNISLSMVRNNIIKQPLETFNSIGNLVFSGTKTAYRDSTQLFMPDKIYNLETVNGLSESNRAGGYALNVEYEMYGPHGNILQISERGQRTAYIWGYNHQYPIAEIKGATYAQVVAALGGVTAVENFTSTPDPTDQEVWQFLQPLLTGSITAYSQATVYTYKSLVGITSQTAPNGMRIYYEYDSAGRLMSIKDTNGHTVKQYQYHYKP